MSGQSVETLELVVDREHNGGETFLEFVASLSTRLFKKYGQARDFLWETPDGRIRVTVSKNFLNCPFDLFVPSLRSLT